MVTEKELKEKLEKVSGSYEDFVLGVPVFLREIQNGAEKMASYLDNHKDLTTSQVLDYLDELEGIKKVYPPIEQGA